MGKIAMTTPLVEMDGDEMTRILWKIIKEELLEPFVDLKTEYYDLGLTYRNETNDAVTVDAYGRISLKRNVQKSQRNHSFYAGRHCVPRAHRCKRH